MTKTTNALALAAIAIVSATALSGLQMQGHEALGQMTQLPVRDQNTTFVTGSATTSVTPDLVVIDIGVDTQAKAATDALSQNAQAMNATAAAIEKLGITGSEISTTNFTIEPVYNNTGPYPPYNVYKNEFVGYKVSNTLQIKTTKLGLAGSILDTGVAAGANRVDSVSFTESPSQLQTVQNGLIAQAVLDAQSKAQKALAPLGEKIVGVKSVNLSEFRMAEPMPMFRANAALSEAAPAVQTPIFTSSQDITTTVDVTFYIGAQ